MSPHDPISHSDDDLTHTGQPPDKRDDLPSTLDPALAQTRRTFDARDKPGPVTADATDAVTPTVPQQTQTDHPAGQLPHDPKTMKMPTNEGTVAIPGYEILGVAGVGGMGIVYKARQLRPNRVVALKMIRSAQDASLEELVRFKIEAEAIADMEHPNIVKLWEVGEYGGLPFFSLEFCAGGSLAQRLKQSLPAPAESAELVETLARAVHYAHSRGVIHRDLKPANVLLQIGSGLPGEAAAPPASRGLLGTPKISDFGLAKRLDVGSEVSRSGHIVGTPAYMSPEQAAGQSCAVGPAADIYALGVILYELLTSRRPFEGAELEILVKVRSQQPVPPSKLRKSPPDLETICLTCLAKEPKRRYPTADALAEDLRRYRTGEPITARPAGRLERAVKWAKRRPALASLLGVTALAVIALSVLSVNLASARNAAERKEREALKQADKAEKARDFLVSIFKISENDSQGVNISAREILKDAEERIPNEFADQPELQEELLAAIRRVNRNIGLSIPQAMILEVRGPVQLQSAKSVLKPAVPRALLNLEDRLTLRADAHVQIVFLADFHKEWLQPGREATVSAKGCTPAEAVKKRVDDLMMTFVHLPKATFYMGWDGPAKPGKKTEIKEDFEIAVFPVTQGQWLAVMGGNLSFFSRDGGGSSRIRGISDEELNLFPVDNVSWDDAQAFIGKLNEREKRRGGEWTYRLPTEAEWEFACRGGATTEQECSYHFYFTKPTNDLASGQANFNGDQPFGNAPKGKSLQRTTRVGAYQPNKLGLCDMHGNVYQWCDDRYEPGSLDRVFRGGSWFSTGQYCRAAGRLRGAPSDRAGDFGFRLVRVPSAGK